MEHSRNQGKSCSQGNPEQTLPSPALQPADPALPVLSQGLLPKPPRPEPAALPEQRRGLPSRQSIAVTEPPAPPRQPARCPPAAPSARHGTPPPPRVQRAPRGSGTEGRAASGTGNSALPEIPPDHTSSSAARFTRGTPSPHTPRNPKEERTPAACAVLRGVRRYFQRVSKGKNNCSAPKSAARHF